MSTMLLTIYISLIRPLERFLKAAKKAQKQIKVGSQNVLDDYFYIRTSKTFQKVNLPDICWFESERNVIRAFTEYDEISFVMTLV